MRRDPEGGALPVIRGSMSGGGADWTLECAGHELATLREDERFALMLRFARAANALRFAVHALADGEEDGSPQRRRQRVNAFMLLAGIVADTVRLAGSTERALAGSSAFRDCFAAILDDPGALAYAEDVLGGVAARAPFRFGPLPAPPPADTNRDRAVLGEARGRAPGSFYYALADALLLRGPLQLEAGDAYAQLRDHFESAVLLADRCADAADRLIAELLREQPWRPRS
jgi:hypothetical protein